jgi:hypothetical protein
VVAGKVEKKVLRKGIKRENVQDQEQGEESPFSTLLRRRENALVRGGRMRQGG